MAFKLKSYLLVGTRLVSVDVYGYATRSIPGIDIVGLGSRGKLIREKINFITNQYKIKRREAKRYVISVECEVGEDKLKNLYSDLEFPILILYWSMASIISLKNLDKCWSTGSVNVDFEIKCPLLPKLYSKDYIANLDHQRILISPHCAINKMMVAPVAHIAWEDLIRDYLNIGLPSNEDG